tara:strand:+ start:379 stop:594 length:216 start_codon:yes stop_codon:yes gene_type:complete
MINDYNSGVWGKMKTRNLDVVDGLVQTILNRRTTEQVKLLRKREGEYKVKTAASGIQDQVRTDFWDQPRLT